MKQAIQLLSNSRFELIITEAFHQHSIWHFDPSFLNEFKKAVGNTPIILCSAQPSTDYLDGRDYGLADVILKPFDLDKLLQKAKKAQGQYLAPASRL